MESASWLRAGSLAGFPLIGGTPIAVPQGFDHWTQALPSEARSTSSAHVIASAKHGLLILISTLGFISFIAQLEKHASPRSSTPVHALNFKDSNHNGTNHDANGSYEPPVGSFPFANNWRDPNTAWSDAGKAIFVICYALFWVLVWAVVKMWPTICCQVKRLQQRRRRARDLAMPLVEHPDLIEINFGEVVPYPEGNVVIDLFEQHVQKAPSAPCLVNLDQERGEISYGAFYNLVEDLAMKLMVLGVTRGSVVALSLQRSVAQVVAMYGVMKSGGAFVPIDAEAPAARKEIVLSDTTAVALVIEKNDTASADVATHAGIPLITMLADGTVCSLGQKSHETTSLSKRSWQKCGPQDVAMVIYTSGTTGKPKGIIYDHRQLLHGVYFMAHQCEMDSSSVALYKSPYFWAVMEWEVFPALTVGARLVIAAAQAHKSPDTIAAIIQKEQVSVLMITPQVLDLVLDVHQVRRQERMLRSVKHVVTAGEPLSCAVANRTVALGMEVHNFYGASESSCTVYTVPRCGVDLLTFPSKVPAGTPQPHSKVFVMQFDADTGSPSKVPCGEAGEICFGGVLAPGYWRQPEITKEKWVETQQFGRLYRTGDLGRWRAGVLEVIGRTDRQVKIRGVRVEPEEVEAVLRKFSGEVPGNAAGRDAPNSPSSCLMQVACVATTEPAELVAFVSPRPGVNMITSEALRDHCRANLAPAYVPKHFVVLAQGFPLLPNGKVNLSELKARANTHVNEEGEMVMDSLGQMRKMTQWAILENGVIHRCYAFWMLGVLTDHYGRCAMDTDDNGVLLPYCTSLAMTSVRPWTELLIRSFGNDQDLFGFILLGAYQDSRPVCGRKRVDLGWKDLFVFATYMMVALPFAQLIHYIFQGWAWPKIWGGRDAPSDIWGWDYMQVNSFTSDHRWYLLMVLQARVYLAIMEKLRCPGWLQSLIIVIPCVLPDSVYGEGGSALDFCKNGDQPVAVQYLLSWIFRNWGTSCPMFLLWVHMYTTFYVWCFHYIRPVVGFVTQRAPKGAHWAALSLGCSMLIGILMAEFHYPNKVLETGQGRQWAWLEIGADILQPSLFALGMTYVPFNLAWWGNTTLGCYTFQFYFKDSMASLFQLLGDSLGWDPTGLLPFFAIVLVCLCFTTVVGPIGHYFLLSPQLLIAFINRRLARRRQRGLASAAREPQVLKQAEEALPQGTV